MQQNEIRTPPIPSHARRSLRRRLSALAFACAAFLQATPYAIAATPPAVPGDLVVDPGFKLFRVEHAIGTQNYICMPKAAGTGVEWVFLGPQATLFSDQDRQNATHFLSANPDENGTPLRATWQDSRDSSAVWAVMYKSSDDPIYVEPDAIPWLLLRAVGHETGPTGGGRISRTAWIQRVHTLGGIAPATGCSDTADLRKKAFVPYEADYYFYKNVARD